MSYTPNVPVSGQRISASRPIINSNFQALQSLFAQNHGWLDAGNGRHTFVEMLEGSAPSAIANYGTVYTEDDSGTTRLRFQDDAGDQYYVVPKIEISGTSGSFVFGGVCVLWGVTANSGPTGNSQTIAVSFGSSFSGDPWYFSPIRISNPGGSSSEYYTSLTQAGVNIVSITNDTTTRQNFNWLAIGPKA